jgi:ATP-dependent exoDNAse (exonuclease V) beta subunit
LSSDGRQRAARLREVAEQVFANRERQPLAHLVRGVWLALGGPACVSESDMEDVASFFELLEELEADGEPPSAQQLTKRLASLFAHPDAQADETLQLMTIHKAKGLEFDTVIAPGLGRRPRGDEAKLLLWLERVSPEGDPELLLAPIKRRGGEDDPLYRFIRRVEHERGCEEERRLLYVAATRARRHLHLLGHANLDTKGDVKPDAASLLHYLWPVVSGVFVQAQIAMQDHPPAIDLAASGEENPPRLRKRLPADWSAPKCPEPIQGAPTATSPGAEVTFDWASDTARHIGTVIHAFLHRIARDGMERWDRMNAQAIRASLGERGVASSELQEASARVQTALQQTLQDERGRWILGAHSKGQSEYAITGFLDGEIRHFQVDRTFVDESGVRWIIDYKTGFREGGSREQFADAEVERYRKQLEDYARVLTALDPGPVRIGLYFPLLGAWREWTMD